VIERTRRVFARMLCWCVLQAPKPKIGIVGALRGFAALAVCWYHFTYGQVWWLKASGKYGWLGVHIFFVISGFIIPYSLYQYHYSIRDYFRFLGKRLARLHPPYLASMAVVIVFGWLMMLAPHFHAKPPDTSWPSLVAHFFYLNDLLGRPWLNVVYWTLGIELQWYLLLGFIFPLIASRRWFWQVAGAMLVLMGHALLPQERIIFHIVPVFLIGVFVFQYRMGLSSVWRMLISIAAMFAIMRVPIGMPVSVASLLTALLIAFATLENVYAKSLGEVSYSLYLLHIPIGLQIINFTSRMPYSSYYLVAIDLLAVAGSLLASFAFYRWIEGPSQKWSSAIKIKPATKLRSEELITAPVAGD
jgi:peptidoglycan/LPS O-acetylase OafA/YrhL